MHGCGMMGMGWYSIFVYVEGYDGLDNAGKRKLGTGDAEKTMFFGGSWGCDDTLYSILFCTIVYIYIYIYYIYTVMICYHYDHCSQTFLTVLIILTFLIVLVTLIVMMVISFIAYFFVVVNILQRS